MMNYPHEAATIAPPKETFRNLSFIDAKGGWSPERSDNYSAACSAGRSAAIELIEISQRTGNPLLLGCVVRCIVAAGKYEGAEIGFFQVIGETLSQH